MDAVRGGEEPAEDHERCEAAGRVDEEATGGGGEGRARLLGRSRGSWRGEIRRRRERA